MNRLAGDEIYYKMSRWNEKKPSCRYSRRKKFYLLHKQYELVVNRQQLVYKYPPHLYFSLPTSV